MLGTLTEKCTEFYVTFFCEDLTLKEISVILQLSDSQASMLLQESLKRLRRAEKIRPYKKNLLILPTILTIIYLKKTIDMKDRIQYLQDKQQYKPDDIQDNNLKKIRIDHGLSQKELSNIAGVTIGTILRMELCEISPVVNGKWSNWIVKISNYFSMSPEDIFPREVCKLDDIFEKEKFVSLQEAVNAPYEFDYEKNIDISNFWLTIKSEIREDEFDVLFYYFVEGLTYKEITFETKLNSVSRVGQVVGHLLKKLKNCNNIEFLKELNMYL